MKRLLLSLLCAVCMLGSREVMASMQDHDSYSESFSHSSSTLYSKSHKNAIFDADGQAHYIRGITNRR